MNDSNVMEIGYIKQYLELQQTAEKRGLKLILNTDTDEYEIYLLNSQYYTVGSLNVVFYFLQGYVFGQGEEMLKERK